MSDQAIHNSLKRNRYAFIDDLTFDEESNRPQKKGGSAPSNITGPDEWATADTTDGPGRTAGEHMAFASANTNIPASGADLTCTDPDTVSEDVGSATNNTPPKPSLQTLPRELRDMIYEFLAPTEERIVLGRRMIEAREANSTWTLDQCFDKAVALHPLSMTCRQFRGEFQDVHFSAKNPNWVLLVNNFNLEQLEIFSDYIQGKEFLEVVEFYKVEEEEWPVYLPVYNTPAVLRFQMDDEAQSSAGKLCQHVFENRGAAPKSLIDYGYHKPWLGRAEIVTQYLPRTTARARRKESMAPDEARCIRSAFKEMRGHIMRIPDYESFGWGYPLEEIGRDIPLSFECLEWCWFDPFSEAVEGMCKATDEKAS